MYLVAPGPTSITKRGEVGSEVLSINNALSVANNFFVDDVKPRGLCGIYKAMPYQEGDYINKFTGSRFRGVNEPQVALEVHCREGLFEAGEICDFSDGKIAKLMGTTSSALAYLCLLGAEEIICYGCEFGDLSGDGYRRGVKADVYNNDKKPTDYFNALKVKWRGFQRVKEIAEGYGVDIDDRSEVLY